MPKETRADRMLTLGRKFEAEEREEAAIRRRYHDYKSAEHHEARASAVGMLLVKLMKVK